MPQLKNKSDHSKVLMQMRSELFRAVVYDFHARLLAKSPAYRKAYCKVTDIPEKTMIEILSGTYDGKIGDMVEILMKVGQAPIIEYRKTSKNATDKK